MLRKNEKLFKDDYLSSPNGQYQLILGQDGNLVIYDLNDNMKKIWESETSGKAVDYAIMQDDGNFVIYGYPESEWVWKSNKTVKGIECFIQMQDDGNLVIVQINAPLWASKDEKGKVR